MLKIEEPFVAVASNAKCHLAQWFDGHMVGWGRDRINSKEVYVEKKKKKRKKSDTRMTASILKQDPNT